MSIGGKSSNNLLETTEIVKKSIELEVGHCRSVSEFNEFPLTDGSILEVSEDTTSGEVSLFHVQADNQLEKTKIKTCFLQENNEISREDYLRMAAFDIAEVDKNINLPAFRNAIRNLSIEVPRELVSRTLPQFPLVLTSAQRDTLESDSSKFISYNPFVNWAYGNTSGDYVISSFPETSEILTGLYKLDSSFSSQGTSDTSIWRDQLELYNIYKSVVQPSTRDEHDITQIKYFYAGPVNAFCIHEQPEYAANDSVVQTLIDSLSPLAWEVPGPSFTPESNSQCSYEEAIAGKAIDVEKYSDSFFRNNVETGEVTFVYNDAPSAREPTYVVNVTFNFPDAERRSRSQSTFTTIPFGITQQDAAKKILKDIERHHLIRFTQVSNDVKATIGFAHSPALAGWKGDFSGFASYPRTAIGLNRTSASTNIVVYGSGNLGFSERSNPARVVLNPFDNQGIMGKSAQPVGRHVLLHEIGHSLGLVHTHPEYDVGKSVMSYDNNLHVGDQLGPVDHAVLDYGYGSYNPPETMGFIKQKGQYFLTEGSSTRKYNLTDYTKIVMAVSTSQLTGFVVLGSVCLGALGYIAFKSVKNCRATTSTSNPQNTRTETKTERAPSPAKVLASKIRNDAAATISNLGMPLLGSVVMPSFHLFKGISDVLQGHTSLKNALKSDGYKAISYTVFHMGTRSLQFAGPKGIVAGTALNAFVDPTELFQGNLRKSIRLLRVCFDNYQQPVESSNIRFNGEENATTIEGTNTPEGQTEGVEVMTDTVEQQQQLASDANIIEVEEEEISPV